MSQQEFNWEEYAQYMEEKEDYERRKEENDRRELIASLKDAERCMEMRINRLKGKNELAVNEDLSQSIKALERSKTTISYHRTRIEKKESDP